jgi:hypothetical protein
METATHILNALKFSTLLYIIDMVKSNYARQQEVDIKNFLPVFSNYLTPWTKSFLRSESVLS